MTHMTDEKPHQDRIALFLPDLTGGGAERMMVNLAGGLAEHAVAVDFVLANAVGPYLPDVSPHVNLVDLKSPRVLASPPKLVRYLRHSRPKAMLATLNHSSLVAIWATRLARTGTRIFIREANMMSHGGPKGLKGKVTPLLIRRFYPKADGIIAVSEGVADDVRSVTGMPASKVHTIYNPVVTPELRCKAREPLDHPWFAPGEPPVVLGVGRLTKQKDFPTLIRAFAHLRRRQAARLVILGEGEARDALSALVRELGIEDDVALPGFVDNPFSYMARASVFVLSSAWEGLPGVLIQAMACGCKVVSTDCPSGPHEVLQGGVYGPLVPVGDHQALADAISHVLGNKADRGSLMQRAAMFSPDVTIPQYLDVLLAR
jgi:glycosyltransferase involved in cell wall biosynthesis